MNIQTICITTSDFFIPIFDPCTDPKVINRAVRRILSRKENKQKLFNAKAVIVSDTGLSKGVIKKLQETHGDALPEVFFVECNKASKDAINKKAGGLLGNCDDAFSQRSKKDGFDMALKAFSQKVQKTVRHAHTKLNLYDNQDYIVVLLESFLLAAFNKAQQPKSKRSKEDTDNGFL